MIPFPRPPPPLPPHTSSDKISHSIEGNHHMSTNCTCKCHKPTLNGDDLQTMYKAGKYEEINRAYAEGRFKFNEENNQ